MARHGIDEDRAFAYLMRVSSHSNVKLRDVAKEVVALRNDESRCQDPAVAPSAAGNGSKATEGP
jgi:hypothetical protein